MQRVKRVVVLQKPDYVEAQRPGIEAALARLDLSVDVVGSAEEAGRFQEAEVLIAPTLPWLPEALARMPRVEWIHFLSAGVDRIWEMPFDKSRYRLSKSSGVHASTISEYVLGAILYVLKGFGAFARQQQSREWSRFWLDECAGKTLGIVGVGAVGSRLAQHASGLGMTVIGVATTPGSLPWVDAMYGPQDLARVLEASDFVVLLVPLTSETQHLIAEQALATMKRGAWLINVSRGGVVDEDALVRSLQSGHLGGAVLDVFEEEPLGPQSPFWEMPNVLVTPHVAGTTQRYMARAMDVFAENYRSYSETGELVTPVSVEKRY